MSQQPADDSALTLHISWKGTQLSVIIENYATKTVGDLKSEIQLQTSLPVANQKLIAKRTTLKDDAAPLTADLADAKILLMGSMPADVAEVVAHTTRIANRVTLKPGVPYADSRTIAGVSSISEYGFGSFQVLPEYPPSSQQQALALLKRLAADPGIVGVMKKHRWRVGELVELSPREAGILGYNQNKGQRIALRLRIDTGFRIYKDIRRVLLHELSHMVYSEHDDDFHNLNRQLNRECDEFDFTGRGVTLGGGERGQFYDPRRREEEEHVDAGGTFVLGSGAGAARPQTREELRERMAQAASKRLTKEEKEICDGCGSKTFTKKAG